MRQNVQDDWMNSTLWIEPAGTGRSTANLYIKLKIHIQWEAPQPLNTFSWNRDSTLTSVRWDAGSKEIMRNEIKRLVEEAWSNRHVLVPRSPWLANPARTMAPSGRLSPSINCQLRVDHAGRSEAHVIVRCLRLLQGQSFRSSAATPRNAATRRESSAGNETFITLDSNDIEPKPSGQLAVIHEFGHYIGLSHDRQFTHPNAQYGPVDIMGGGTRSMPWHAYPWCRRLRRHLGGDQPASNDWHQSTAPLLWKTGRGQHEVIWEVRHHNLPQPQPRASNLPTASAAPASAA